MNVDVFWEYSGVFCVLGFSICSLFQSLCYISFFFTSHVKLLHLAMMVKVCVTECSQNGVCDCIIEVHMLAGVYSSISRAPH